MVNRGGGCCNTHILYQCSFFLQSMVQLGFDFLSPESLGKAVKMAEEIRCLPNDHEAKLQVLEVRERKLSLEAFSASFIIIIIVTMLLFLEMLRLLSFLGSNSGLCIW